MATGGDPIVPRIAGVDRAHVHTAESVLATADDSPTTESITRTELEGELS